MRGMGGREWLAKRDELKRKQTRARARWSTLSFRPHGNASYTHSISNT